MLVEKIGIKIIWKLYVWDEVTGVKCLWDQMIGFKIGLNGTNDLG